MKLLKNKLAVTIIVLSVTFLVLIIATFKRENKSMIESGAGAALNPVQSRKCRFLFKLLRSKRRK